MKTHGNISHTDIPDPMTDTTPGRSTTQAPISESPPSDLAQAGANPAGAPSEDLAEREQISTMITNLEAKKNTPARLRAIEHLNIALSALSQPF